MTRHAFSKEESIRGAASSKRSRVKVLREIKKITGLEIEGETLVALLSNPAVVGTALYVLVGLIKPKPGQSQTAQQSQFMQTWTHIFGGFLGTVGIPVNNLPGSTGADNIGFDALQASLLIYIASGGNLAGVLSSSTGLISKLLPAVALK